MTLFGTAAGTLPGSIASLDLGYIARKLLDDDSFEAQRRDGELLWDEERAARAIHEYKQFLALMYWNPEATLVPSEDIDDVWHTHVLHTGRYHADCETIFGCFQHHYPASGDSDDLEDGHMKDREETLRLFDEAFGEIPQSYTVTSERRCGRMTVERRCGRISADRRCGRTANRRCGRMAADRRCGRITADRRCGRKQ